MEETIRFLIFIAFVGMLFLLRLDAPRFTTAEYDDETGPTGLRVWLRRLTWYALGILLVFVIYAIHPLPISVLRLDVGADRQQAVGLGLLFGLGGTMVAFVFAWWRYRRLRLPAARHYPGAAVNALGTAFVDEALFRGVVLGLLLTNGLPLELAIAFQAIGYGLATRLAARGRSRWLLLIWIGVGVIAGYVTTITGGIGAAIVGHAVTRFAIFLATGHAGQVRPSGSEPEEEVGRWLPPRGWQVVPGEETESEPDVPPTSGRLRQVRPG